MWRTWHYVIPSGFEGNGKPRKRKYVLVAKDGAKIVRATLDKQIGIVDELAGNPRFLSNDTKEISEFMAEAVKRTGFFQIGIASLDGSSLLNDGSLTDISDREYFKSALTGKTVMSDVLIHRVLGIPIQVVAAPVMPDGKNVEAVVFAIMDATWLSATTDEIGYGEKGYSYIIDKNGTFIAYVNREDVLKQRNIIEESKTNSEVTRLASMFTRMTKGETGFDEYPFLGSVRFFGYTPVPGTDWSIAVGAHKKDVFAEIAHMRMNILWVSLGFIICGIFLMSLFAKSIVKPIRKTVDMLKDISGGEGDLTQRLTVASNDEIGEMAQYFNTFIGQIHDIIDRLSENAVTVSSSATELSAVSAQTMQSIQIMSEKTSMVARASEE